MNVQVANRQRAVPVSDAAVRRAALWTMRREGCPPGTEVSIALVDDAAIRALNRRYRRVDRATDVLAFPQDGPGGLLGDVVVSAERAVVQAPAYGHAPARELRVLIIHGMLHLLGYDDATPAAARRMRGRQEELLRTLERAERRAR